MNNFGLNNTVDEVFFGSLKGKPTKLQQLFVEDVLSPEDKQQSLKYQRPKVSDLKNKDSDIASSSNASSITLMAKVVNAFREGKSQGKVGLALILNSNNTCVIIIYKTRTNILTNLKFESNILYKQFKYWQFYDEQSVYWSFSFDTEQDEEEFKKNLETKDIPFKEIQENVKLSVEELQERNTLSLVDQSLSIEENDFGQDITSSIFKDTKSSLIKRMAKMGKPLPNLSSNNTQAHTDFSDSSDTEVIKTPLCLRQKPSITPRDGNKLNNIKTNHQLVPSAMSYNSTTLAADTTYPINRLENQYMQMLLTEQRTQGSELRMNMNKLENKIEKVLDKLDLYDRQDGKQNPVKDDEILELEEKLLMLKKENRKLKQSLEEKSEQLLEENKLKSNLVDFKEDLSELNINYKNDLIYVLKQLIEKLKETLIAKQDIEQRFEDSEKNHNNLQRNLILRDIENKELENHLSSLKEQEKIFKLNINEKELEIKKQKEQIVSLKDELQEKNKVAKSSSTDSLVKSIMNNLYVDIADKLDNSNLPHQDQILKFIASSIRQQTLESLEQLNAKQN